ncbi:MAG: FGGY family carbohydrate kinase, partial [Spirochaetales bacterium]|nr:FGGY family carbohydrate kinase [Spirochaetales bacterium]
MANKAVLSIDIGTTSLKLSVIDERGFQISYMRRDLSLQLSGNENWNLANQWEHNLKKMLAELPLARTVEAVCVTGNGPTLVPIGEGQTPLFPVISWVDTPSKDLEDLPSLYLSKLIYAAEKNPKLLEQTKLFVGCPEYVTGLLCGEFVTFIPDERFIPFIWDYKQLELCGIRPSQVPAFVQAGEFVGRVTVKAADSYGLPYGVPVFAGMTDFHAALLGCGAVHSGMVCDRAGTSEGINYISTSDKNYPLLRTLPSIIPSTWTVAGLMPASGEIFEWYRKSSGQVFIPYEEVMGGLLSIQPSAECFFYPDRDGRHVSSDKLTGGEFSDHKSCLDDYRLRGRAVADGIGFTERSQLDQLREAGFRVEWL